MRVQVEQQYDRARACRMRRMDTMQVYQRIKRWEPCLEEWARTRGEVGKLGALVIEPYLDESSERLGRIILTQCRAGCFPSWRECGKRRPYQLLGVDA